MHAKFAAWLSQKTWRAGLFSAIFGLLSPQGVSPFAVVAGAIPVFMALRFDVAIGAQAAVAGSIAIGAALLGTGNSIAMTLICVLGVFWIPLMLALVLKRTASLNLSFQLALLGVGLVLTAVYLGTEDPVGLWHDFLRGLLADTAKAMTDAGLIADEQVVIDSLTATNWGAYATLWLLTILCSLFLGRWWQSLLDAPGEFGREYRQLRLGQLLGAAALVIVVGAFAINKFGYAVPLLDALMWIAMTGLAAQGLSAAHKLKASGFIGRAWLIAMYVLLVVPLSMGVMVVALAVWGLADNWRTHSSST